jgi:ABC-type arginine transport system permease subunit
MTTVESGTTDLKSGSLGQAGTSQSSINVGSGVASQPSGLATSITESGISESTNNTYTYIFAAVLSVVLILLLYYAYSRFITNTVEEPMTKGTEQERDDPVIDFNLREAIKDLQNMQKNVMATLSENSEF